MSFFKRDINPQGEKKDVIPAEEDAVLEKFAKKVVEWRMAVPAILFIESGKPLNYVASQAMIVAQPFAQPLMEIFFDYHEYDTFRQALERRENVENVLQKIEKYDAEMYAWEKRFKKFMKTERKKWKWYQRYLGLAKPKLHLPDDLQPPYVKWKKEAQKQKAGEDTSS